MEASRAVRPPRARPLRLTPLKRTAEPAFEQLYRRHARDVYQYALALLTNPADAEDAAQTTFLNAYRAFQRGERPQKPHNWLIAITHNVCRMRWRQAGSRPQEVALEEAPEPVALEHDRPNLDEVLTALAGLSFNQRAAIVMRELEGRSYQEIAGVLDLSVSAVEALIFRARRRLQLNRKALGVLSTAPLPGSLTSLTSLFGAGAGGGAVAAGGGGAFGAGLVLKAAAVVVAGAVAGAGYRSVQAVTASPEPAAAHAQAQLVTPKQNGASAVQSRRQARAQSARGEKLRRATPVTKRSRFVEVTAPATGQSPSSESSPAPTVSPTAPVVSTVAAAAPVAPPAVAAPPVAVPPVSVPLVPVQVTPPPLPPVLPLLPVPPAPPLPPVPPLPVTVPTLPLPPPPIK
jgi:RNA polymerase sigma factor (sigma-70 family)